MSNDLRDRFHGLDPPAPCKCGAAQERWHPIRFEDGAPRQAMCGKCLRRVRLDTGQALPRAEQG
jgi:hypothetical protein